MFSAKYFAMLSTYCCSALTARKVGSNVRDNWYCTFLGKKGVGAAIKGRAGEQYH